MCRCPRKTVSDVVDGLSNVAIGWWHTNRSNRTAGRRDGDGVCGDGGQRGYLRVERVYLDSEQAYKFAQDYNGIARMPVAKRRGALRHTDEGERFDDFAIRQEWWTGEELPDATVVRRELAGVPKVEVAGLSKEKVEELFWDTVTQVRAELAGVPRK